MNRILIVGSDSVTGTSIASHLSSQSEVKTLSLSTQSGPQTRQRSLIESFGFADAADFDTIIFCGGAAGSSWNADFGCFDVEKNWLSKCAEFANNIKAQLVYISSDAVFSGPWVFHTDGDNPGSNSRTAKAILKWEGVAASATEHLIVRCNVLGLGAAGFLTSLVDTLEENRDACVDAGTSSTILLSNDFARTLLECVRQEMTGQVNIAGGERTTPFLFATQLAGQLGSTSTILANSAGGLKGQSLRCDRLREQSSGCFPLMKETHDKLVQILDERRPFAAAA